MRIRVRGVVMVRRRRGVRVVRMVPRYHIRSVVEYKRNDNLLPFKHVL